MFKQFVHWTVKSPILYQFRNIQWLLRESCSHLAACYVQYISYIYREVPEKDAKDYADSIHAIFVETSAKNAININEVFTEISECFLSAWCCSPERFQMLFFNHTGKLSKNSI